MSAGYALSPLQRRLLALRPDADSRRLSVVWASSADPDAFADAVLAVCRRHEILHSRFVTPAGGSVVVQIPGADVVLDRDDAEPDPFAERPQLGMTSSHAGDAWRHELVTDALVLDPGCVEVLTREIDAELSREVDRPAPLEHSMMSEWLAEFPHTDEGRRVADYWSSQPAEGSADATTACGAVVRQSHADAGLRDEIIKVAAACGATATDVVAAAYAVVAAQFTGEPSASIDVYVDGRLDEELRDLVSPIGRLVPLRTEVRADTTVAGLVGVVARARDLAEQRAEGYTPPPRHVPQWGLVHLELPASPRLAAVDMRWSGSPAVALATVLFHPDGITIETSAPESVPGADDLAASIMGVLRAMAGDRSLELDVGDVNALEAADDAVLLAPVLAGTPPTVMHLFDAVVATAGESIAVHSGSGTIDYATLDRLADHYAAHLEGTDVRPADRVVVQMRRGADFVAALVGCWRVGAVVVPVDPQLPEARVAVIREDSGATSVLTELSEPAAASARRAPAQVPVHTEAYCIYTSGSTGRPKGVVVSHEALAAHIVGLARELGLRADDRTAFTASTGFDVSLEQACLPWVAGGAVVPQPLDVPTPDDLSELFDTHGVTHTSLAPTVWRLLARRWQQQNRRAPASMRLLELGAERVSALDFELVLERAPGVRCANSYGPTETVISATMSWLRAGVDPGTIGWPIAGRGVAVVDSRLNPVPPGVVGQLLIWGSAVAEGYQGSPELTTAARARPAWLAATGVTEPAWLTGDYVHLTSDGLVYDGRRDRQVKVRGQRVELDEIERVLTEVSGGRPAAVTVSAAGVLVAAVAGLEATPDLRAGLAARLPAYMVPKHLVPVSALPRLPNGKTDYPALAELKESEAATQQPRTETERRLAVLWSEVLNVEAVGRDSDFFDLGGESLAAIMVVTRVREELGLDTSVASLMRQPRLADFAAVLDGLSESGDTADAVAVGVPGAVQTEYSYRASHAQRRLWFVGQFVADPATQNAPMLLVAPQALGDATVDSAWTRIAEAHDALRTTYEQREGDVVAVVHHASQVEVRHVDVRGEEDPEGAVRRVCHEDREVGFDITRGPIGRVTHFRTPSGSRLFVNLHHIATDLWSAAILVSAFVSVVEDDTAVPRPIFTCKDHAEQERAVAEAGAWQRAQSYLVGELTPPPAPLELPIDLPRPAVQSFAGDELPLVWDGGLAQQVGAFARQRGLTSFMVLLTAYLIALRRWTNQGDIVVGFPIAGREDDDFRDVVGFFVATSFVRVDMSSVSSVDELLHVVRDKVLAAVEHHTYPFDALVSDAGLERAVDRPPAFSVMLAHQDLVPLTDEMRASGWRIEELPDPVTKFELSMTTWVEDGRLQGSLAYCTDLFTQRTAGGFAQLFERCLRKLVDVA